MLSWLSLSLFAVGQADEPKPETDAEGFQKVQLPKSIDFKDVKDGKPIADSRVNPGEATAYKAVIQHASRCPLSALERHARKAIDYNALMDDRRGPFLQQLLHYEGRLVRLKKIEVPDMFPGTELKALYEAWIFHQRDPEKPICFVFTDLPEGLEPGEALNEAVGLDGYYFKILGYVALDREDSNLPIRKHAPLLLGRTLQILEKENQQEALDEATRVRLPRDEFFDAVRDERPLASREANEVEYTAYGFVFRHAHKFDNATLERHARRNVVYSDLIENIRLQFLRELLHVEGRLVRLRKYSAGERLKDTSTIKEVYEGWIYHENMPEHPICITFTELPAGIQVGEHLSYRVSFDGYYFKLLAYKSQEKNERGGDIWRKAPLLIGRGPKLIESETTMWSLGNSFLPLVVAGIGVVAGICLGLTIWYRRGDRRVRDQMRAAVTRENPFQEQPGLAPGQSGSAPVQPGSAWEDPNGPLQGK